MGGGVGDILPFLFVIVSVMGRPVDGNLIFASLDHFVQYKFKYLLFKMV